MDLGEIRNEFSTLHAEAAALMSEVLHMRPSIRLVLARGPLQQLEDRLDKHLRRFVELDAQLIRHANPPSDFNTAVRFAAHFSVYSSLRDSVRALVSEAAKALGSLRSQLDFLGSLGLSVLALLVSIVAIFVQ